MSFCLLKSLVFKINKGLWSVANISLNFRQLASYAQKVIFLLLYFSLYCSSLHFLKSFLTSTIPVSRQNSFSETCLFFRFCFSGFITLSNFCKVTYHNICVQNLGTIEFFRDWFIDLTALTFILMFFFTMSSVVFF